MSEQRFQCGRSLQWCFRDKTPGRPELRRVKNPKKANVKGPRLVLYEHDDADRYDANAIVTVGGLRWYYGRKVDILTGTPAYPEGSIAWKRAMRNSIERGLGVRPRLENPDHAEREVAALLRARAAESNMKRIATGIDTLREEVTDA